MQKTALLIILLLISAYACNGVPSQKVAAPTWLDDLKTAQTTAAKENKSVLLEFSTEWCPYCKFIDEKIFTNPSVAEKLTRFVLVKLDGDKASTQNQMDEFNIKGFPTFVILKSNGRELTRFNDVSSTDEILARLEVEAKGEKSEEKLKELLADAKDDKEKIRYAGELIDGFPPSPYLPSYYKELASAYSSTSIKNNLLAKAAKIIENNMERLEVINDRLRRITLDEQVDLLADIYKELNKYDKISKLYLKAGQTCEKEISQGGGIKNNTYLIGTIAYYYLTAGAFGDAERFLKKALKDLPDYWPVYTSYAKVKLAGGLIDEAIKYAAKAYGLAEEVAKPKIAMMLAECYAAKGNFGEALAVLKSAKEDLVKTGAAGSGRAAKVLSQIEDREKEYTKTPASM